jgi:hypothetical protein
MPQRDLQRKSAIGSANRWEDLSFLNGPESTFLNLKWAIQNPHSAFENPKSPGLSLSRVSRYGVFAEISKILQPYSRRQLA